MKHLTWPAVAVFITVLAALAAMFGLTDDPDMRKQILGYFDSIVPFILGIGAGAAAGVAGGYATGLTKGQETMRAKVDELQMQLADAYRASEAHPHPESVRRAAEVVRVAAEESHQAADEARTAALALKTAAEEGRAVAELQRSVLAETRRASAGDGPSAPGPRLQGVSHMR
jgi:hypothetical protein